MADWKEYKLGDFADIQGTVRESASRGRLRSKRHTEHNANKYRKQIKYSN